MPGYNPEIHHRRSIRLKGYDYSQAGLYFITICVQERTCLFGTVVNGKMILNEAGKIAVSCWLDIPAHFPNVTLHEYVVMPNHIHGIIELSGTSVGAKNISPEKTPENISSDEMTGSGIGNETVGIGTKYISTGNWAKNISTQRTESPQRTEPSESETSKPSGTSQTIGSIVRGLKIGVTKWMRQNSNVHHVWQRNYYEHIIHDELSYIRIARYINDNPAKWQGDKFYGV